MNTINLDNPELYNNRELSWLEFNERVLEEAFDKTTKILMESTSETAEIAADPTLLTIIVSTVPIREESNCSMMIGIKSLRRSVLLYK